MLSYFTSARGTTGLIFAGTAALLLAGALCPAQAEDASEVGSYRLPPKHIADLIDAPRTPMVMLAPNNEWYLVANLPPLPPIEEVAQPEERLAGIRINPRTHGPSRSGYANALTFRRIEDGLERPVSGLPKNPKLNSFSWSPDGTRIAFIVTDQEGLTLWSAKLSDGKAKQVSDRHLNASLGRPYAWLSSNEEFIARLLPEDRGAAPAEPLVPVGPIVQENVGRKAAARTYQDLLENEYDEDLFTYYTTSQLAKLSLEGKVKKLGEPGIHATCDPAPGGEYILVETFHKPFSYALPYYRFPHTIQIWDLKGKLAREVADNPLADQIPISYASVATGPRSASWRNDAPATLCWAEALDGGDGGVEADERDRVFLLDAPFKGDATTLITLGQRYDDVLWGRGDLALVTSWWWTTRNVRAWHVAPDDPSFDPELVVDRSWEDRYNDPGQPLTTHNEYGESVMLTSADGKTLFLTGDGASPEGDRPFIDEFDLATGESTRLFRSEAPHYERPIDLLDVENRILLTRRESVSEPRNYFVHDLKSGEVKQTTSFPSPTPQLADVQKELIRYERADGVQLTATLYLPPGYDAERDGPLPMLMWAYPQEYKSADAAGQVTDSPYRFVRVGWWSPMLWLIHGFAVLDDPAMPIVGEGDEEPNDTFVEQLVASAEAAVEEVVRRGVADRGRIAIGGHSYGAFMTAHLLAHTDLFRLGLARSGAYNRTLTPFGFQSEERSLWEAPDVYWEVSPFMHADKIDEPILLVHGEADNNSGTYPLQSERFYGALKGHGATVRLVMLPHESHSYRARESVMHVTWETADWLDRYVKDAEPRP